MDFHAKRPVLGRSTRPSGKLFWLMLGAVLATVVPLVVDVIRYWRVEHRELPEIAVGRDWPLESSGVKPDKILEGDPTFLTHVYAHSRDVATWSGIWECKGPTKARFVYTLDETVYVLEGGANIEYNGAVHALHPGSVAFFPAGATATWDVPERIKKSFVLSNPGRLKRFARRLLFSYP